MKFVATYPIISRPAINMIDWPVITSYKASHRFPSCRVCPSVTAESSAPFRGRCFRTQHGPQGQRDRNAGALQNRDQRRQITVAGLIRLIRKRVGDGIRHG